MTASAKWEPMPRMAAPSTADWRKAFAKLCDGADASLASIGV
jgi:hypothetical protein